MGSPKIPIYFSPKIEESLTSWLIRLSAAHGLSVTKFLLTIFSKNEVSKIVRDITYILTEETVLQLSQSTGVSFEDLINSSFLREKDNFSGMRGTKKTLHKFIRSRRPYCPLCFADNSISFHKKDWRLAFNFRCRVHDQIFLDECPQCGGMVSDNWFKIEPHLVGSARPSEDFLRHCPYCENNLGETDKRIESFSEASNKIAAEVMDLCAVALVKPLDKFTYGKSPPITGRDLMDMVSYFSEKLVNDPAWVGLSRMVSSEIGLPHPLSRRIYDWSGISSTLFELCQFAAAGWIIGRSSEQLVSLNEANLRVILPVHHYHRGAVIDHPKWMNHLFPKDYIRSSLPYPAWKNFDGVWLAENY